MMNKVLLCGALLLGLLLGQVQALTLQQNLGTSTSLLTTDLDGLGNNVYSPASAVYDNRIGQAGNGALRCSLELLVVFAGNPTPNTAVVVWLSRSRDGTNYEPTPTSAVGPGSAMAISFLVNSGQTTTRGIVDIDCPPAWFKATLKNDNTGQAFQGSGANFLKITPIIFTGN